jgi:signal transduction histidine kinase
MPEKSEKILVVDDEYGIREGCRKVLSLEGYRVVTAEDGLSGLELFEAHKDFAAALIDLKMPRMGGIELIEKIRARDTDIVLMVITANATIESAVEATKRGAFGYVPKPFTPDELLLHVRQGLDMRAVGMDARRLRREKEARLLEVAQERSKSNTIIQCISDALLVVNLEDRVVLINEAGKAVFADHVSRKEPFPLREIGCAPLQHLLETTIHRAVGPSITSQEIQLADKTYLVSASPVIEPAGTVIGAVSVLRDISALKSVETAKSMFVSMVAHELKNPVAAVEGYLDLSLAAAADEKIAAYSDVLTRAKIRTQTLRRLIDDLFTLQVIETGRFKLTRKPVALSGIIEEALKSCEEKAVAGHIGLSFQTTDAGGKAEDTVLADAAALHSVFVNLIDNAIKYSPEHGRVQVHLTSGGEEVVVRVEDRGIGLAADEIPHIFDEFYRVRGRQTAMIPGTGLGLSLVKKFVDMHHGTIAVASTPGKGSVFKVSLPACHDSRPG